MHSEKELFLPPRSIRTFSELVPHPTPQTDAEIRHIQTLSGLVGMQTITDTLKPFFTYEKEHTYSPEKTVYTTSLIPTIEKDVSPANALTISEQLLSGLTWHYAFIHNEQFSVPSTEPLHDDITLPFNVTWENNAYRFIREHSADRYKKALPKFLDSLYDVLPTAMERKILSEINEFKLGI